MKFVDGSIPIYGQRPAMVAMAAMSFPPGKIHSQKAGLTGGDGLVMVCSDLP